tara:strand:+ start:1441 stop:2241 length:801 start_codon:yes stop_codon:yes gene_type:complete
MKDLKIGMILEDGSRIICIQKLKNIENLYLYSNKIYVSGDSKAVENGVTIFVKNSILSIETECKPPFGYYLTTSTGVINIRGNVFVDYNESRNIFINKTINSIVLNFWNNKKEESGEFAKGVSFLDNGFAGNTKLNMQDGTIKRIEDVLIGDVLENNNAVIGKAALDTYYFLFYEFCGIVVSSNTKVYDNIYWKNIECVSHAEPVDRPEKAFNLITEKSIIKCKNNYFLDYTEKKDYVMCDEINKLLDIGFTTSSKNNRILYNLPV